MLELRRYEDGDSASVWRLHHEACGRWARARRDDDLRSVRESYLSNGGEFLVGTADGEVIAMGAVRRVCDTVAEIKRMRLYEWSGYREVGRQVDLAGRETIRFEKQLGPPDDVPSADLRASGGFGDPETYDRGRPPFPAGVAEAIPPADAAVDAVFVAEREIASVLTPDGHFVLVSQHQQWWERAELPRIPEFDALMEPFWEHPCNSRARIRT